MPFSIQRFSNCSEAERAATVLDDQTVMIGSADDADLRLHLTFGMPDVCLKVWGESGTLIAENMIRDPGLIFLNGAPLSSIMQLEHGDLLQIGNDQFAVVFSSEPTRVEKATPVEIAAPVDQPTISHALESNIVNAKLARHTPVDGAWNESSFLEHLCEVHDAFLFANFRHARLPEPDERLAGNDLFKDAPDEVRELYSLHAIASPPTDIKLRLYEELRELDAAIWVVPEVDSESSLVDAKIHLAWFARPSVMSMTLKNSPEVFCESLLAPFKSIILRTGGGKAGWAIYCKSEFDPSALGIGERLK